MQAKLLYFAQAAYLELPQAVIAAASFPLPTVSAGPFVAAYLVLAALRGPSVLHTAALHSLVLAMGRMRESFAPHTAVLHSSVLEAKVTREPPVLHTALRFPVQGALHEREPSVPHIALHSSVLGMGRMRGPFVLHIV